jgi:hypothetical protein
MIEISSNTVACSMTLSRDMVYELDTHRGDISRSKYVLRLLQKALQLELNETKKSTDCNSGPGKLSLQSIETEVGVTK